MTSFVTSWYPPPSNLQLGSDEVHVWRTSLNQMSKYVSSLQLTLSADERDRAERFYFQQDREHFIVARGLLRTILSYYSDIEPSKLRFCYNPQGKPSLAREFRGNTLRFNLSHSRGLALYGITRGREIGIDVECLRHDFEHEQIAKRYFSLQEVSALRALVPQLQMEAFFKCWTCKEAYIKAKGEGLSIPLDQFDVSLNPGEPPVLLTTKWDPEEALRWCLLELVASPGYVAALAVEGHSWQLKCWQLARL